MPKEIVDGSIVVKDVNGEEVMEYDEKDYTIAHVVITKKMVENVLAEYTAEKERLAVLLPMFTK